MKTCFWTKNKIFDYIDETLSLRQMEAVKHHLSGCQQCFDLSREFKQVQGLISARHTEMEMEARTGFKAQSFWSGYSAGIMEKIARPRQKSLWWERLIELKNEWLFKPVHSRRRRLAVEIITAVLVTSGILTYLTGGRLGYSLGTYIYLLKWVW